MPAKNAERDQAYGEDLAYIHDAGFGEFAEASAPWLLETLRAGIGPGGCVVDLGCGSGRWARRLVDDGYRVIGIDISPAMIRLARRRVPEAQFRAASLLRVSLPRCDAVTALGECFNYLFDERAGPAMLTRLFRRVHAALRPGGLLVFDVAEPGRGKGGAVRSRSARDWVVISRARENARTRELTRNITSFRKVGRLYRRADEVHRLRLYRSSDVAGRLRSAGFRVRVLRGYGSMRFPPSWVGFMARKAGDA